MISVDNTIKAESYIRQIKLDKIKDVYKFVELATNTGWVSVSRGSFRVDGSSMMGMFAIDPSERFTVEYSADNEEFDTFIKQFIV